MTDLTVETFEKLKGDTFTLLAFGGPGEGGVEYEWAEIPITLEKVTPGKPVRYGAICRKNADGTVAIGDDGKKIVEVDGDVVPNLPTPFMLEFHAPHRMPLMSDSYTVKHPKLGTIERLNLNRFKPMKPCKHQTMDGGKAVEVDGHAIDEECCILRANFG